MVLGAILFATVLLAFPARGAEMAELVYDKQTGLVQVLRRDRVHSSLIGLEWHGGVNLGDLSTHLSGGLEVPVRSYHHWPDQFAFKSVDDSFRRSLRNVTAPGGRVLLVGNGLKPIRDSTDWTSSVTGHEVHLVLNDRDLARRFVPLSVNERTQPGGLLIRALDMKELSERLGPWVLKQRFSAEVPRIESTTGLLADLRGAPSIPTPLHDVGGVHVPEVDVPSVQVTPALGSPAGKASSRPRGRLRIASSGRWVHPGILSHHAGMALGVFEAAAVEAGARPSTLPSARIASRVDIAIFGHASNKAAFQKHVNEGLHHGTGFFWWMERRFYNARVAVANMWHSIGRPGRGDMYEYIE